MNATNNLRARRWRITPVIFACIAALAIGVSPAASASVRSETGTNAAGNDPVSLIAGWFPFVHEASQRFGIAEDWIKAVMRMESGGHTKSADGKPITSRAGAMGLMQLMPETWNEMRDQYALGDNPYDPHDNVIAGTAYLRWLYQRFGFPKMFAAYNAGPAVVDAQTAGAGHMPAETRNYLRGITQMLTQGWNPAQPDAIASLTENSSARTRVQFAAPPAGSNATFTRPDGVQVTIDASTVTGIRSALSGEYTPGVQTVVSMAGRTQGVLESPADVTEVLRRHGARV